MVLLAFVGLGRRLHSGVLSCLSVYSGPLEVEFGTNRMERFGTE